MIPGSDTVTIDYFLHAPADYVWNAWTNSVYLCEWFGSDPDGVVLKATVDVRVGGSFEVSFRDSSGLEHTCFGVYTDVRPFHTLQFTWGWRSEPGVESRVSLVFESVGSDTRMHFTHAGVGTASAHNYNEGWRSTFKKLDRLLLKNS